MEKPAHFRGTQAPPPGNEMQSEIVRQVKGIWIKCYQIEIFGGEDVSLFSIRVICVYYQEHTPSFSEAILTNKPDQ